MFYIFVLLFSLLASLSRGYVYTGTFDVEQKVLLYDEGSEPVGYTITTKLLITSKGPDVYLMKVINPGLHIMSRKAPTPHGFVSHSSKLDDTGNKEFIVEFGAEDGLVSGIHLSQQESVSMRNIKRSLVSAIQLNRSKKNGKETDSSGLCQVEYIEKDSSSIMKLKSGCSSNIVDLSSDVLGGTVTTWSRVNISLDGDSSSRISSVHWEEDIIMQAHLAEYSKARVSSLLTLTKTSDDGESGAMEYSGTVEDIVENILIEVGGTYIKSDLTLEKEPDHCLSEKCPQLDEVVKEMRSNLGEYGSTKSSSAILSVADAMKRSTQQQIYKVLNSKDNKQIIGILLDIAGSVQTFDSHQAVLKKLKINTDNYKLDYCERYFWALSMYPKPSLNITKDVVQLIKTKHHDKKLFQTILQTGAAMTHKMNLQSASNHEVMTELISELREELSNCESDDESCRQQYLLALGQTRSALALPVLIKYSTTSTYKSGVTALKGILKLGKSNWTPEVFKLAEQVLMSETGYDSTSRAISLEILMSQNLSDITIRRMLSLLNNRKSKEINQLILEKLYHKAEKCENFKSRVTKLIKEECTWNDLAQGGLSTSFSRHFMDNGYLSTDQEISKGILKQGLVNVNLIHNKTHHTLFTLGLFSGGLGSFMSSNEEAGEEEEEATAGMQIQLLGVEFRPFVFFTGSGDLMGHVWSGTASTKTPAYQAAIVVNRNSGMIAVGSSGVWANLKLDIAASLELAGLIEISIWNRNAHSAVFNRLGLSMSGGLNMNSDFVKTKVDLQLNVEPSLDLTSQIDFSSKVALCLKLYQPSSTIRYNTYKVERIPGSKHKLRKSRYSVIPVPGKTYALNQKNNEMCNKLHQE